MATLTLKELETIAGEHTTRPASDVKSQWRSIVEEANEFGEVIVTNYNRPEVVVVSIDQYANLKAQAEANDPMARLRAQWDRELAWLREPDAGDRLRAFFDSTPEELAEAANAHERKTKK